MNRTFLVPDLLVLRSIPPTFDQEVVARIDARLADIRVSQAVAIPLAIESGSRAWGFPSPDSDYDSRFVFVRRLEDYLSPWPKRDVIETPLDGILDVNGWDLRKALALLLKGNAAILEWVQSPIQYGVDPWFQAQFLVLATEVGNRDYIIRHYRHTADRQRELHLSDHAQAKTTKLFYVLRPLLALRWLRQRPTAAVPPMHCQSLMAETDLPPDLKSLLLDLIADKASAGEQAQRPIPTPLLAFIESELAAWQDGDPATEQLIVRETHKQLATSFLRASIERFAPA